MNIKPTLLIPPWDDIKPLIVASSSVFIRSLVLQLILTLAAVFATRAGDAGESLTINGDDDPTATTTTAGTIFISAHQIALQLWLLCSYTSDSLAAASQGLIADALGRKDINEVRDVSKTVFTYSAILGCVLGGINAIHRILFYKLFNRAVHFGQVNTNVPIGDRRINHCFSTAKFISICHRRDHSRCL